MLKDVINILKDISLRHKAVRTFRYQGDIYNNAQNNYKTYQVYCDDVSFHQLNITTNIFKAEFQLYILGFPENNTPDDILDVQNNAYTIAADILAYIDTQDEFKGVLSVYDYSILTLSHYSDDNSAGVKLSVVIEMPSPVNLCELDENFNSEPYEDEPDKEIDIDIDEIGDIDLKPITLPRSGC
ncbi:MAG: hypothetical protein J6S67_06345 [Methanobrevibacter sp.]|nr:hypothetical protein [Methanobrevibacter sp.]